MQLDHPELVLEQVAVSIKPLTVAVRWGQNAIIVVQHLQRNVYFHV